MSRSLRRHQKAVARIRKSRILMHSYWWRNSLPDKPWRQLGRMLMNEPGYWVREMMTRPARVRANQLLHLVELGRDDAEWRWPDGKKPHLYYW